MLSSGVWIAGLLVILSADPRTPEGGPPQATEVPVVLRRCTTDYVKSTLLGATIPGILQDCLVQTGDAVKKGQVLGRIQDREVRAEMELRRAQAESDVEIRLNEAKHARTLIRLRASERLKTQNVLNYDQLSTDRLDETIARLELESAQLRRRMAQLQLAQSQAAVSMREIVATHDGVVVAVLRQTGETVTPLMPIFQVVDPDRILVVGNLDVHDATRVRRGQPVRVSPVVGGVDMEIERTRYPGRITFVNALMDAKTQTCKVYAEIDNRKGTLRAGLSARMEILGGEGEGAAAAVVEGQVSRAVVEK